jgi:hypothetical protein
LLCAESYRAEFYWFESVALLRRVALVLVTVLVTKDPQLRAQLTSALCLALLLAQIALRPFQTVRANRHESVALFALVFVALFQDHHTLAHGEALGTRVFVAVLVFGVAAYLCSAWIADKGVVGRAQALLRSRLGGRASQGKSGSRRKDEDAALSVLDPPTAVSVGDDAAPLLHATDQTDSGSAING